MEEHHPILRARPPVGLLGVDGRVHLV